MNSILCKDILQDILGNDYGERTVKLSIKVMVFGSNRAYSITSDCSFFELLQRNVDVRHQIHLVVDVEDVITTSTSPLKKKKKPRVKLEEVVDNSLAIVSFCDVGTSNQCITEASTSITMIDEGPQQVVVSCNNAEEVNVLSDKVVTEEASNAEEDIGGLNTKVDMPMNDLGEYFGGFDSKPERVGHDEECVDNQSGRDVYQEEGSGHEEGESSSDKENPN